MRGRGLSLQLALFAGAGLAILAGASFNIQGYTGQTALLAMLAGTMAWSAGLLYKRWPISLSLALSAIALTAVEVHFAAATFFGINTAGLFCLGLGGVLSAVAYAFVTAQLRRRVEDMERLNRALQEQHRMFLAATEDPSLSYSDMTSLSANTLRQVGAEFCVFYFAAQEGKEFQPQLPGAGFAHGRPQTIVARREGGDPILDELAHNREFYTEDSSQAAEVSRLFSAGVKVRNLLIEPMMMGSQLGGFLVLGNLDGGFDQDDRRLAQTLAIRAAIHFASQHIVAQTQDELARYALLNDIARQASGLPFEDVMNLVLRRAPELVAFDSARVITFESNEGFLIMGGSPVPGDVAGTALEQVKRDGRTLIRRQLTRADGLFSGVDPGSEVAQAAEALAPITGRDGVFGVLCLGRRGGLGFGDRDIPALQELGAIAGVAVENSRILQRVSGHAVKVTTALDALADISQALTATTEGIEALQRRTLEVAARLGGASHAILTRVVGDTNRVICAIGFSPSLLGYEISNGQGVIGAVALSREPLAIPDVADSFDLATIPDLAGAGLQAALCVPVIHQGHLWGTLSVFASVRREWTEGDERVLSTLGNQAVVALKNAELFDSSQRMVWELGNLMDGLTAVTSTLDLDQVLKEILKSVAKATEAQIGVIALEEDGTLQVSAATGSDTETARRLALELGAEICREVVVTGTSRLEHDDRPAAATVNPLDPRSVLCVPLRLRGKPIGVVFLANYVQNRPFSEDHRRLASELGAQATVAIENARLFRERELVVLESLKAMAQLVDAKDPYTAGHSDRVTQYSLQIARELKYRPGDRSAWKRLEQGGLLHDIGKISVPDAILTKSGPLTGEELAILRRHPLVGHDVLKNLHLLTDELDIVRSHHERYDGRGYPEGRAGDDLPITSWIVSAADAFDAMTSDRPYRKGMSLEMALAEISRGRGTQFHPAVADAIVFAARRGDFKVIPQVSLYADAPVVGAVQNPSA